MLMWWGKKIGKYYCSAVKFPRTATIYPSFWETEECCTVCFPILHYTYRGECHVHAHRSADILLQTYMSWEAVNVLLHCMFKPVADMHGMAHINVANNGSLSTANNDLWSRPCETQVPWEHKFKSMGAVGNCCSCLSLHRFAFVVSCRMWKESVSSWV